MPVVKVRGKEINSNEPIVRVTLVTMDTHLNSAAKTAYRRLLSMLPDLSFTMHAASDWCKQPDLLSACLDDINSADIILVSMLFMEEHFQALLPTLKKRRMHCDAMICIMSAPEIVKLTRMKQFDMSKPASGLSHFLKKLRGGQKNKMQSGGAQQMRLLRRLPKLLKYIPGSAQDVRAYFLTLQYWLGGSEENFQNLLLYLIHRYGSGPRMGLIDSTTIQAPIDYPEIGVYHPRMPKRFSTSIADLPRLETTAQMSRGRAKAPPRIGVLLLRSYLLAGNSGHYDGVINALEAKGLQPVPVFAAGLDARPAIERFFRNQGKTTIDAMLSLTGFSLVGGPAYNDAKAAEEILASLDVPYLAAHPVEFQTLAEWGNSQRGLSPVESTIMVAIPELDGSTVPTVFGGRPGAPGVTCHGCGRRCTFSANDNHQDMSSCPERADMLAMRLSKLIDLRHTRPSDKKVALVIFNFPPNAGATGSAAFLSVFASLYNTLRTMRDEGYQVNLPDNVDALRDSLLEGNKCYYGAEANVHARIATDDHVRREPWLDEIEKQWGPAPGRHLSNGQDIFVLGQTFGNVLVAIQPGFGYEGDPMRLLFEQGHTPTHAFSAFYRYLREDFGAAAILHFGTHGALEFMPGKQSGNSGSCWPDRLIRDVPNLYLYASNNPSEGALAKRRAGATLISYLCPPLAQAGLYKELAELKSTLERWRNLDPHESREREELWAAIASLAQLLDLKEASADWPLSKAESISIQLNKDLLEFEYALIPSGLHIVGQPLSVNERTDMLLSIVEADDTLNIDRLTIENLLNDRYEPLTKGQERDPGLSHVSKLAGYLTQNSEIEGIMKALAGRYIRPAPGGDLLRQPAILPTGRNLHGFDPFRIPSPFAVKQGRHHAQQLLERYKEDGNPLPASIAFVLWGTDNLKSEGGPIAQALALMGAEPRFDSYGRLAGAKLITLEELGRPRIDVVITISGIFRDLLPLQIKLLAEGCLLAAKADEPLESNFIKKHALSYMEAHGCDLETAALRVYGNADGAYGAHVNHLIDSSSFGEESELAEAYATRKGFAYGIEGRPQKQPDLLAATLKRVQLTYQNLDSVELGVTTIDNYFDTLGGITGAAKRARGDQGPPVYIGDQTRGKATVRTLSEQVALETRTRALNPKWYNGMLQHGYEGVRQIEEQVKNTLGWSATTGQVQPWIYEKLTETYMLDEEMRDRLAKLNPTASSRVANRLIEASQRAYWSPDKATLEALNEAADDLEDIVEGVGVEAAE